MTGEISLIFSKIKENLYIKAPKINIRRSEMCSSYIAVQVGVFGVIIYSIWNGRLEENEICFRGKWNIEYAI